MSQAESDPTGFAAFATFLGTPLPENPIRALRILRHEAAREIERLIDFLDALGGDPDLEDGADAEPTLGWPSATAVCSAPMMTANSNRHSAGPASSTRRAAIAWAMVRTSRKTTPTGSPASARKHVTRR